MQFVWLQFRFMCSCHSYINIFRILCPVLYKHCMRYSCKNHFKGLIWLLLTPQTECSFSEMEAMTSHLHLSFVSHPLFSGVSRIRGFREGQEQTEHAGQESRLSPGLPSEEDGGRRTMLARAAPSALILICWLIGWLHVFIYQPLRRCIQAYSCKSNKRRWLTTAQLYANLLCHLLAVNGPLRIYQTFVWEAF